MPSQKPDDDRVQFTLRLPPDLHLLLVDAAGSERSLNAEVILRLRHSFMGTPELEARLEAIMGEMVRRAEERARAEAMREFLGREVSTEETREPKGRRRKLRE